MSAFATNRILVGLIGANIQGSLSPRMHEDAFAAAGLHGFYHLMDLERLPGRTPASLLAAAIASGFRGLNITYPAKEAVLPLLDDVSDEARQIGAVNTITIDVSGRTKGYNTDRVGFRRGFEEGFGREAVAGKTALLVGAGGAGRAVAFALFDLGARLLLIHDKDSPRSAALAAHVSAQIGAGRCRAVDHPETALADAAGAVNATPVGMKGIPGLPLSPDAITERHWVADVIYTPLETELLKAAKAKGARIMGGSDMAVFQAAEGFRLWTGKEADIPRMKHVFAEAAAARDRVAAGV